MDEAQAYGGKLSATLIAVSTYTELMLPTSQSETLAAPRPHVSQIPDNCTQTLTGMPISRQTFDPTWEPCIVAEEWLFL